MCKCDGVLFVSLLPFQQESEWEPYVYCNTYENAVTGVDTKELLQVAAVSIEIDPDITLHKTLTRAFVQVLSFFLSVLLSQVSHLTIT